ARVVLRMSDDDDERAAALTEDVQTSPHELRAYALALAIREHSHRAQSHPDDSSPRALDHHRRKEDVTHDGVIQGHEGQQVRAGLAQSLDEVRLRRLPERELVGVSNPRGVFRSLGAAANQASSCWANDTAVQRRA